MQYRSWLLSCRRDIETLYDQFQYSTICDLHKTHSLFLLLLSFFCKVKARWNAPRYVWNGSKNSFSSKRNNLSLTNSISYICHMMMMMMRELLEFQEIFRAFLSIFPSEILLLLVIFSTFILNDNDVNALMIDCKTWCAIENIQQWIKDEISNLKT